MYCTQCGRKAETNDKFCASCGNELGATSVLDDASERSADLEQDTESGPDYPPLASRTEYFRDIWDKLPIVLAIKEVAPQTLALVDIVFTSERIIFLPCNRSRWDTGHLMILGAVGGPIGLLVASGASALWDKLTQSTAKKDFDGLQLDKLVREGLAISASNSDLEISMQQVNKGIAHPGTWTTFSGVFTFGPTSYTGSVNFVNTAKAKGMAKQFSKICSVPARLLPPMASNSWDQLTATGKYLASIDCKSELVVMRRRARSLPFPERPTEPSVEVTDNQIADLVRKHEISKTISGSFKYRGMRFDTLEEAIEHAERRNR